MLVSFARANDMVPLKSTLACDPLPIYPISFGRFIYNIPEIPNSNQKAKEMMCWMNGCSHGVTSQLLEVHGVLNVCNVDFYGLGVSDIFSSRPRV